jgi:hypothetical protein
VGGLRIPAGAYPSKNAREEPSDGTNYRIIHLHKNIRKPGKRETEQVCSSNTWLRDQGGVVRKDRGRVVVVIQALSTMTTVALVRRYIGIWDIRRYLQYIYQFIEYKDGLK